MNASSSGIHASFIIQRALLNLSATYGSFCILILSSGVSHVVISVHFSWIMSLPFWITPSPLLSLVGLPTTGSPGSTDPGSATLPPCFELYLSMKLCLKSSTHLFTILLTDLPIPVSPSGPILQILFHPSLYKSVASFTFLTSALVCSFTHFNHSLNAFLTALLSWDSAIQIFEFVFHFQAWLNAQRYMAFFTPLTISSCPFSSNSEYWTISQGEYGIAGVFFIAIVISLVSPSSHALSKSHHRLVFHNAVNVNITGIPAVQKNASDSHDCACTSYSSFVLWL